jgi:hypothetical protein
MLKFFAKTVVTGFALALGAAIFKRVSKELGLDDKPVPPGTAAGDAATDPGLEG